jgi:hypothetical protein
MARQYAQLRLSMWTDDRWLDLPPLAQHLYVVLLSHPTLSYAGVLDWRPGRLIQRARGWHPDDFDEAARVLAEARYIVVDESTEEVLLPGFLRNDTVLEQPRLAVSYSQAFSEIASRELRAVSVHELNRLHRERPQLKCWADERVQAVLSQRSVDSWDLPVGYGARFGVDFAQTPVSGSGSFTTSTSTSTPTSNFHPQPKPRTAVDNGSLRENNAA